MRQSYLFKGILLLFLLSACADEDETFHPLELEVKGIELTKEPSTPHIGEIPSSGTDFIITGKGKYADMTYITEMTIDGVDQGSMGDFDAPPYMNTYPILVEGEWGQIKYITKEVPYVMLFQLKATHRKNNESLNFI